MEHHTPFICRCLLALAVVVATPSAAQDNALTLQDLIELVRKNDLRVHEAEAELHLLQAKYREAWWAWFPKLETTVSLAGPTPEARNDGLGGPPTTQATLQYDLNFGRPGFMLRTDITGVLPLYTFGKLKALREAGEHGVHVGENLKHRAESEAVMQATEAYFGYQLARQGMESLKETQDRISDAAKLVQKLLEQESPQVTKIDSYKVDFFKRQVDAKIGQVHTGQDFAVAALKLLTGAPSNSSFNLKAEDFSLPDPDLRPVDYYLDMARDNRSELKAIEEGLQARQREVFIRERMFLPDLGIGGFFRFAYTSSATRQYTPFAWDPYNDLSGGLALVARGTFDIPVKQAQLDQSKAELEKLTVQRQLLSAAIRLEVQKVHGELKEALGRATAFADAERSARRWSTAAYANFELGTGDTRELVDAFTAFALASTDKLKSWYDVRLGRRQLAKAAGMDLASQPDRH